MTESTTRKVGRRTIKVSNLDKVLWPADAITKGDLIDYYEAIAPAMIPHTRNRLMTLERYPDGIGGGRFFAKGVASHFPEWIDRATVPKEGGTVTHAVCNRADTLVYLANLAAITMHVGLSRVDRVRNPDQMIFDLDPAEDDFSQVRAIVGDVKALLEELGLAAFVRTSGSKGLHVMVPLDRKSPYEDVRAFARDAAGLLAARDPKRVTIEGRKEKRKGRLYMDWMRNSFGQHAVASYTVRARPEAPVAMPVDWSEIDEPGFNARSFSMSDALERTQGQNGDAWSGWRSSARSLRVARKRLDALLEAG